MRTHHSTLAAITLAATALVSTGCQKDTTPSTTNTTGAQTPVEQNTTITPTPPPNTTQTFTPQATTKLNDAQILQVTHTANKGEIEQAKLALKKSNDARVKKLAQMMIDDHTAADHQGDDVAKKENISFENSPVWETLKNDGDRTMDDLKSRTGKDFDTAYVDDQVTEHQAVIDLIDQKLMTSVQDADVKSYLQGTRDKVQQHLQHARDVQTDLASSNSANAK